MFLNLTSTPKIAQKGPKKKPPRAQKSPKEAPNMDVLKTKDRAVLSKPKLIVYIGLLEKKFLNLTPTQKIVLKGQKRAKRPQLWPISNKDGALLPKPKFVVYINRPKAQVQFDVLISSFNFKFQFQV